LLPDIPSFMSEAMAHFIILFFIYKKD
jgi:hypothetical protein